MKLKVLWSGSSGNCYLLQGKEETLILECGISYKKILKGLNFYLNKVVGCLVSHEHKDHSKAIQDLMKNGIDIYTSKGTAETCGVTGYRVKLLESEKVTKIGSFIILPFETQHDAAEPLGFLIYHKEIGNLLFITDSYYCKYKFHDLNHILVECNYSDEILKENLEQGLIPNSLKNRLLKSHFSLANVKGFLNATDVKAVKEIILIHLSDRNSNAVGFKTEVEKFTGKPVYIANKGLEIELEV
ncbi:putative metallo-hydrolase YycJ [Clostridium tepidiprofundi DSM 19306]|uniref:Putative metallo-hydrolase YycJ n=1 Tax=Clostridium tepidiprofundi DSM 19306 TaxID=1121338 RepID=A0A151B7G7_9CLOT|nr:MBL fold metallo-hydrolase [Clostridium tepidiprofundi]KYH35865.1 putative metallo-hydrolase YycJ [Clostridium tepidiprofundi DSM 19306]